MVFSCTKSNITTFFEYVFEFFEFPAVFMFFLFACIIIFMYIVFTFSSIKYSPPPLKLMNFKIPTIYFSRIWQISALASKS